MRRVYVRAEQEQVRMLTEENAALRLQLTQQAERLRADALVEVCVVCLLHVGIRPAARHQRLMQISWHIYLYVWLRGRNDFVVCFHATQERVKEPAALVLNDIRLRWLLVFHGECWCALYMQMRLKYRIHKKMQAKEMMKQMFQSFLRDHMAGAVPAADVGAQARDAAGEAGAGVNVSIPLFYSLTRYRFSLTFRCVLCAGN